MKNFNNNKQFWIQLYFEQVSHNISMYIYIIKKHEYPYQLEYWKKCLKEALIRRSAVIKKIQSCDVSNDISKNVQLKIWD